MVRLKDQLLSAAPLPLSTHLKLNVEGNSLLEERVKIKAKSGSENYGVTQVLFQWNGERQEVGLAF